MNAGTLTIGGAAIFLLALALTLWSEVGAAVFLERAVTGLINCF